MRNDELYKHISIADRAYLERMILVRLGQLDSVEHIMESGHEPNAPYSKNHLTNFEMAEVKRVNQWRPSFDQLQSPTPSMYEASRLMRYLPTEGDAGQLDAHAG